jgi:hypothetical protein
MPAWINVAYFFTSVSSEQQQRQLAARSSEIFLGAEGGGPGVQTNKNALFLLLSVSPVAWDVKALLRCDIGAVLVAVVVVISY